MKKIFFLTILAIFVVTAVLTLLGIVGIIELNQDYASTLVTVFIVETGGAVLLVFRATNFFDESPTADATEGQKNSSLDVSIIPPEDFAGSGSTNVQIMTTDGDSRIIPNVPIIKQPGALIIRLNDIKTNELISLSMQDGDGNSRSSGFINPRMVPAMMELS